MRTAETAVRRRLKAPGGPRDPQSSADGDSWEWQEVAAGLELVLRRLGATELASGPAREGERA
jgi:hypothetical protein